MTLRSYHEASSMHGFCDGVFIHPLQYCEISHADCLLAAMSMIFSTTYTFLTSAHVSELTLHASLLLPRAEYTDPFLNLHPPLCPLLSAFPKRDHIFAEFFTADVKNTLVGLGPDAMLYEEAIEALSGQLFFLLPLIQHGTAWE